MTLAYHRPRPRELASVFQAPMGAWMLRAACVSGVVGSLAYCAASVAINSAWLSHGILVVWPVDGLILGLMLGRFRDRPWLTLVAGLAGTLLAFVVVGKQMNLAYSRVGLMALSLPFVYEIVRRVVGTRTIAEVRALLPFLLVCAVIGVPTALARAALAHALWGFPVAQLTMTTASATFTGYAVLTPLILLSALAGEAMARGARAQLVKWGLVLGFVVGAACAFEESRYPVAFLVPVALVLMAHIIDFTGIVVIILVTGVVAVGLTLGGHGPIADFPGGILEKIFILQGFMVTMICGTLPFSALMSDNSKLKRSLITALFEARAASDAKSTFLATVSHEIRTPLNGVLGMAQAMEMDELAPAQRERVTVLRRSGESLLMLLNDVLDLSKVEAGKLLIESVEFQLDAVIQAVLQNSSAYAASESLRLEANTDGAAGVYSGDPNRLRQIIQNLVSNALKFTEAGGVSIAATYEQGWLSVRVEDTGIGIAADRLDVLFEKFTQADESTTRRFGGTGLGLSISRELARAMGGDVFVESVVGVGSAFTLRVPLERLRLVSAPVEALRPAPSSDVLGELRVLAAEDNPTNRLVLKTLLAAAGVTPTIVENGQEAVVAWRDGDWDLLLMDIHMPVMDGLAAVRAIRAAEAREGRRRSRIFALTANAMDHQVQEYVAAGMDGYLTKPILVAELFTVLAESQPNDRHNSAEGLVASGPADGVRASLREHQMAEAY